MSPAKTLELVEALFPFDYRVIGPGNDEALPIFMSELDFQVHEFDEESELNGWTIPRSEIIETATIRKDGELIYDGLASPLGAILCCSPFVGTLSLEQLREHLFFHSENEDAIPFHCTQQYRPGKRTWGFCLPRKLYDSLLPGDYDIEIIVHHHPTTMKVLDFELAGTSKETILIQAHNCHPFQANDDMSGCAVGIRLIQRLMEQTDLYFTYRLVICPELTGSVFWLDKIKVEATNFVGAIILPAVGNDAELRLQRSYRGQSALDKAAAKVMTTRNPHVDIGDFRTVYGNDETVFDAAGYEIPTISVTRYPFSTYHSQFDTPEHVAEHRLEDTISVLLDIIKEIESSASEANANKAPDEAQTQLKHPRFVGRGLYCLSHPRYGLYKRVWDPSDRNGPINRDQGRNWNLLMTNFPRLLDGSNSLEDIATKYQLPLQEVEDYCNQWVSSGLVERP